MDITPRLRAHNKAIFQAVTTVLFLFLSFTVLAADKDNLTVTIGPAIEYQSKDGKRFTARYGSLSDGSLHFVKITMPNGDKYTLPQVISGSGVRYTDERELVWWEHQGTVRVDVRNNEGKWITKFEPSQTNPHTENHNEKGVSKTSR